MREVRDKLLGFKVEPSLRQCIQEAAKAAGLNQSVWMREAVKDKLQPYLMQKRVAAKGVEPGKEAP